MQIKKELQKNKQVMQEAFRDCGDIIMREFRIRGGEGTLFLAYTDNIVNGDAIQNFIMTNVMARCEMQGTEGLLQSLMSEMAALTGSRSWMVQGWRPISATIQPDSEAM